MRFSLAIVGSVLVLAVSVATKGEGLGEIKDVNSSRVLTDQQQAAKTAFEASLTAQQKTILESQKMKLDLTDDQKALAKTFKQSLVSNETKMANTAGFDAIKSSLPAEAAAKFNAADGTKGLNLTKEQKMRFKQAANQFLGTNATGKDGEKNGAGPNLAANAKIGGGVSITHAQGGQMFVAGAVLVASAFATLV